MKIYKTNIPGSGFFWGLVVGIIITIWCIFTLLPGYKILPVMPHSSVSGDALSVDDSKAIFEELYHLVSIKYYDTGAIDQTKMLNHAMAAFVDALGDPFSSYLPPEEGKEFKDAIDGHESLDGIGAVLSKKDGGVLVEEVLKGSPAAQSDVKPLDMIIKVNGSGVQQLSISEVVQQIRGKRGTKVKLTIARSSSGVIDVIEKEIERDTIIIPSVSAKLLTVGKKKLGYIALSLFAEDTDEKLQLEIANLKKEGISGFILDLRGNGGGLLPESVDVSSHFLSKGTDVVKVKYRLYADSVYKAKGTDTLAELPLIILTDGFTASASEITTLALKEGRCKNSISGTGWIQSLGFDATCDVLTLGTKTFGKGSIQDLQNLDSGGSIKLTVGKRFSPSGLTIDHIGIQPDIEVAFDKERYEKDGFDSQLEKAKSILSQIP